MSPPRVIGLAGPYCAGKNSLTPFFQERGYTVLDLDRIGHRALERERGQLVEAFGSRILSEDGTVDRRVLGRLAFASRKRLRLLESIVHPSMKTEVLRELSGHPERRFVLNAAVLFRMGLNVLCDLVVWVDSPWWLRLWRGLGRDHLGLWRTLPRVFALRGRVKVGSEGTDIITVRNRGDLKHVLQALREEWEKRYGEE